VAHVSLDLGSPVAYVSLDLGSLWSYPRRMQHFLHSLSVVIELMGHERRLKALVLLNALDTAATLVWVLNGLAEEANPLMAGILHRSPCGFVLSKLALVQLGVALLWRFREAPTARHASWVLCLMYSVLVGWHLVHVLWFALL